MAFPRHILERVERVYAFHRGTKWAFGSAPPPPAAASVATLAFPGSPRSSLPTTLLDVSPGTLSVLESSVEALPDSFIAPPQTLKTLATWLYMSAGVLRRGGAGYRVCPSLAGAYPAEIYVAAFALQDLEPGLYHFNPRGFTLHKLRDGAQTLAQIKRGRPDLEFVKRAPAALLVSTVYERSTDRMGARGYRGALLDAGQLTQGLVTTAGGLGIQTITRLRMTESTLRELIGVPPDAPYAQQESVQSMVVWADRSQREAILTHVTSSPVAQAAASAAATDPSSDSTGFGVTLEGLSLPKPQRTINEGAAAVASLDVSDLFLPSAARHALAPVERGAAHDATAYGSVLATHQDCVAPGVAVREIRPPLTELTPLPAAYPHVPMSTPGPMGQGVPLRAALLSMPQGRPLSRAPLSRDAFRAMCRLAFAGGSYFPMFPDGSHAAFPRAFWVVHNVAGMEAGIWYHRPDADTWCLLREGAMRLETHVLAAEDDDFANAAAVGFVLVNLVTLLTQGGPDTYRLAHLEAGAVARRLALAAEGFRCAAVNTLRFFDDDVRTFLGLGQTGWEPVLAVAVGVPVESSI